MKRSEHHQRSERDVRHERIETLIGADVRLEVAAKADAERPSGAVKDFLASPKGKLEWAVVSCDGREVLIPAKKLQWHAKDEVFSLAMTKKDLQSKPTFDLAASRESGLERAVEAVASTWDSAKDAMTREASHGDSSGKTTRIENDDLTRADGTMLCGDEVDELELFGTSEEWGGVTKTLVDPESMCIDLVVVNSGGVAGVGGTDYLVPFCSLVLCRAAAGPEEDQKKKELRLYVPMSAKELQAAPEYEAPESDDRLVTAANRSAALSFFGVEEDGEESRQHAERNAGHESGQSETVSDHDDD